MAEDFTLLESGFKSVQHMLTDWLPRSVYFDLTDDTVRVDVEIRKSFTGKCTFNVSFIRYGVSVIKKAEYMEERILGKVCKFFSPKNTRYIGKRDGFDHRLVSYTSAEPSVGKTLRIERS